MPSPRTDTCTSETYTGTEHTCTYIHVHKHTHRVGSIRKIPVFINTHTHTCVLYTLIHITLSDPSKTFLLLKYRQNFRVPSSFYAKVFSKWTQHKHGVALTHSHTLRKFT